MHSSIAPTGASQGDTAQLAARRGQVTFDEIAEERTATKWQKSSVTKFHPDLLSGIYRLGDFFEVGRQQGYRRHMVTKSQSSKKSFHNIYNRIVRGHYN